MNPYFDLATHARRRAPVRSKGTSAAKADFSNTFTAGLKACSTRWASKFSPLLQSLYRRPPPQQAKKRACWGHLEGLLHPVGFWHPWAPESQSFIPLSPKIQEHGTLLRKQCGASKVNVLIRGGGRVANWRGGWP